MCGIAGVVALDGTPLPVEIEEVVARMGAAQNHRGPDDRGVARVGHACLGSVRLSILDLSVAGHMPMCDPSERYWLAYNGEVYNYRELRAELQGLGHAFRSETDTEVVLHAFMEWGAASLERLSGMFAFAFLDRESGVLTLVRDRLGIKPLHYHLRGDRLAFGSELKALRAAVGDFELDVHGLLEWTLYQSVDAPSAGTLYRDVRSLLPGELLRLVPRGGRVELEHVRYYDPPTRVRADEFARLARASTAEIVDEIDGLVRASVTERLVSDVPVGTLLSGGLDSSLVTCVAAAQREVTAFHVSVVGGDGLDERPYAEQVARKLGIELVTHAFTAADFRRELPRVIHASDLPLTHANSVAYALISRVAREKGVIVLQSGEGADELFGGYSWRYRRQRTLHRFGRLLARLPRRLRTAIELGGAASARLPVDVRRFEQLLPQAVGMLDGFARAAWRERCEGAYPFVADELDRSLLGAMLADLGDFLTPLLRRLDRMSMAASVECRVPFLNHHLVELAMHLPLEHRVGKRADKWALKEVARRYLPDALVDRKKMGFPLPLAEYLAPLAQDEFFRDGFWSEVVGIDRKGVRDAMARLRSEPFAFLALVSAELWGRMSFLGESVEESTERIVRLERAHGAN